MIQILLVDDHQAVREGLAARINAEPDMRVVDSCGDADSALALVLRHRPHEVLMDVDMPGMSCFAAARAMADQAQDTRVIFFSAHHHDRYIDEALGAGAWGYVTKGDRFAALCDAVRSVAVGRVYFSDDVKARMVARGDGQLINGATSAARASFSADSAHSRASTLTPREREVVRYLASGMSVKEIARTMHIAARTVDNHKSHIMEKLDIHDRVELTRFALREGIATL